MEDGILTILWTFESQEKAVTFLQLLKEKEILFEVQAKGKQESSENAVTLYVDDGDYTKAKRLLTRHRRRKTNS